MRRFLLIATIILFPLTINAQLWKLNRYELSAGIGSTQFYGDIGGYSNDRNVLGIKDFTFRHTRISINSSLRYRILQEVAVRLNLTAGTFHSTDARGSNTGRGFESMTTFFEPALLGEYYIIKNRQEKSFLFLKGSNKSFGTLISAMDIYVFGGFGGLLYHVKPNSLLAPHETATNGFTGVIPLGIGVKLNYAPNFNFGLELGGRFTFSDNIDGYTSPLSKYTDVYHILNLTFTYKLRTRSSELTAF